MRWSVLLAVALAGCGSSNPITPPGTTLFEWDTTKATRPSFKTVNIGTRTTKDLKITLDKEAPFVVDLHIETAEIVLDEGGTKFPQTSPVVIRAKVKANDAWELSGKCVDGPNYKMGPVDSSGKMVTPLGMQQDCSIRFHRRSGIIFKSGYQLGTTLIVSGDGTVKAFPEHDAKIE